MKSVLFNSHDIVLALVIVLCFLLAFRVRSVKALPRATQRLLPAFFVLSAFVAIDTLLFWGDAIKFAAFELSPWLPMSFSFASFAVGPVLFWAFRSLLVEDRRLSPRDLLQLLPAVATIPYLYWACYQHPFELQRDLVLNLTIFSDVNVHFMTFLTMKKLMPVIYGILCIALLFQPGAPPRESDARLLQPYVGFVFIWFWVLLTHLLGQWLPTASSDLLGIFGNYMSLTLVAVLVLRGVAYPPPSSAAVAAPVMEEVAETTEDNDEITALAERIHKFIQSEKPYLNARLTLERFAGLMDMSPRQVSLAINRCFEQNFHEYINGFRVAEAKRLLHDDSCLDYSILEIAQQSGFNSKATFNRIFKIMAGVTPTAYRREFSPPLAPHQHHC